MTKRFLLCGAAAALAAVSFSAGYALRGPVKPRGDMLDAVAAVQRRAPMFLVSARDAPRHGWVREGGVYLSRTARGRDDLEGLPNDPSRRGRLWDGVLLFKGCGDRDPLSVPLVALWGRHCLDYGDFAVYGDPELLAEVRTILAGEGFEAVRGPR